MNVEEEAAEKTVTVCSHCHRASCWQGIFFCDEYRTASTVELPVSELRRKKLESPDYWRPEH